MKTRRLTTLLVSLPLSAVAAPPAAPVGKPDPVAAVRQFLDTFNSGDLKAQADAFAPGSVTIIDEFSPFTWSGSKALASWNADYDKNAKAEDVTEPHVSYGAPTVVNTKAATAYVTLPTVYTYKSHGKPTSEEANMAYALTLTKAGWKIRAWSWTGTVPHPAK